MAGYAKLFSTITESSLWRESKDVRILFVSMLAKADAKGFVEGAVPGLASMANLTIEEVEAALLVLESPDKYSKRRSDQDDGRRLRRLLDGWLVINYEFYRKKLSEDNRREYERNYRRQYRLEGRDKSRPVNCGQSRSTRSTQAEAEAEAEAKKKTYSSEFSAWYEVYPRHVGKGQAAAAYGRAIKRICAIRGMQPPDAHRWLVGVTRTFARSPAGTAGHYTPHPSTWLNHSRYEDDPAEWMIRDSNQKGDSHGTPRVGRGQRYIGE